MQSLAEMLMNPPKPHHPEESQKRPKGKRSIAYSLSKKSLESNADKPCAKCGHPERHRSKSGHVYTTLCTKCYRDKNAKYSPKSRK